MKPLIVVRSGEPAHRQSTRPMPAAADLPECLRALAERSAINITDTDLDHAGVLIQTVEPKLSLRNTGRTRWKRIKTASGILCTPVRLCHCRIISTGPPSRAFSGTRARKVSWR